MGPSEVSQNAGPCPSVAEIERLAGGETLAPEIVRHVEECGACRGRIETARTDASFLERVRMLAARELGPENAPRIPGYRVTGAVSSGAQGVVYRGVQESTARTVAIKTLMAGETVSARQRLRAEREAEIAARLRHANIVAVFESRVLADGRIAVVMEYIDGVPLDVWQPAGATAAERQRALLRVFIGVCNGIHHAHLNGVIHRDLKPDNILVTAEARAVVLDFGIAKAGGIRTTMTGEFAGTPAYASPEQASGRPEDVDALADIYSLGVILYKLLCRAMPYEVEGSIFEIARTIMHTQPVPPRRRDPALSPDLEAIVMRAIRKDKQERYQSAADLARDLERYLAGHPVEARGASGWYLLRKAIALNRARLAWAGGAALLLVCAGVAVVISLASAADSARLAELRRREARAENVRARAVTELLRAALPGTDPELPELAGIVGSGLGRLYLRLETGAFADDPEMDQALRRLWAGVYTGLGSGKAANLVEYAESALRRGLVKLRLEHGAEHVEIASGLHELAGVVLLRRRAPEAELICRDAIAMREGLLGGASVPVAESRALLAKILLVLGRDIEAAREADAALVTLRTLPEREADLPIAAMSAIKTRVLLGAGDAGAAEPVAREALLKRIRRLPPEDPDVLASLADAADVIELCGDCALARELGAAWEGGAGAMCGAIRADVRVLALPDRAHFLRANPSGRTLALGRFIRLQEVLLGPDDPALVGALTAQMRSATAERMLSVQASAALRAAEILSKRFGPDDESILVCIDEAAVVLAYDGRPEEAIEPARRACRIRERVPGAARDRVDVANCRRHLGLFLALAGRCGEAVPEQRAALEELRAVLGADHHLVALAESDLAFSLSETGALREADELSAHAETVAERSAALFVDQSGHIRFVRGHVLTALGRAEDGRRSLGVAWEPMYKAAGAFPWRRVLIEDMVRAHETLGDAAGAARWRAELARGPTDPSATP